MSRVATDKIEISGIMLRREPEHQEGPAMIEVLAEVDGQWLTVIGPQVDEDIISHIVEPSGIRNGFRPEWITGR